MLQGLPLQKLHHDKRFPVLFSGVIDRADIGVIQCRRGLRLALEPGKSLRIACYTLSQKLERDETVETSILSLVDDAHPAATKLLDDTVMRDGLADHCRRIALSEAC